MAKLRRKPANLPSNPFKAGAGHSPPHLAGRARESGEFARLLGQDVIMQNVVLTGLRGVGKTVLMDDVYKPLALKAGWVWVGSDFSESAFVDEISLCYRLLTDLSAFTSTLEMEVDAPTMGLKRAEKTPVHVDFNYLVEFFNAQPGLNSDKLKATLQMAWRAVEAFGKRGIVFAYDEAQVVRDREDKDQYPLALLLETFQSLQRKGMRAMLLLTGLPTLFSRLVESRTYAERMFTIQEIGQLDAVAARTAITEPLKKSKVPFPESAVKTIVEVTCGYPYFLQFMCREAFDFFKSFSGSKIRYPSIPIQSLLRKLDADFFSGRWSKVPDRQRELLLCIACLENAGDEFTVNQIVDISRAVGKKLNIKPFKAGDVSSIMPKLINAGLVYKNRHGRYLLAVPLFDGFIKRQFEDERNHQGGLFDDLPDQ
jgi:hypothetical protein